MKRPLLLAAVAVVAIAHAWSLVSTQRNRAATTGGNVELSERELRLPPLIGDSTALMMDLEWAVAGAPDRHRPFPDWLDADKLTALGFDCQVPVSSPDAREHYARQRGRLVYLVLEFEGESWKQTSSGGAHGSRLFVIDAGRDPVDLRTRHPDARSQMITRGVVRLVFEDHDFRNDTKLAEPRLRGSISMVLPSQVFVPRPFGAVLQGLRRREGEAQAAEPRYAVTVAWGRSYEPWVQGVRLLGEKADPTTGR